MNLSSRIAQYDAYLTSMAKQLGITNEQTREKPFCLSFDQFCRAHQWTQSNAARDVERMRTLMIKQAQGTLSERLKREAVGDMLICLRQIAGEKQELEDIVASELCELDDLDELAGAW